MRFWGSEPPSLCLQPFALNESQEFIEHIVSFTTATLGGINIRVLPALKLGDKLHEAEGAVNSEHEKFYYIDVMPCEEKETESVEKEKRKKGKKVSSKAQQKPYSQICARIATSNNHKQLLCEDIKAVFLDAKTDKRGSKPKKGQKKELVLALTSVDLFQADSDLFLAGLAWFSSGFAVFSIARYDPKLTYGTDYWYQVNGGSSSSSSDKLYKELQSEFVKRAARLFAHEAGHLLQITHCTYYDCLMNGSGNVTEDVRQPLELCPIDARKICSLFHCDPEQYFRDVRTAVNNLTAAKINISLDENVTDAASIPKRQKRDRTTNHVSVENTDKKK